MAGYQNCGQGNQRQHQFSFQSRSTRLYKIAGKELAGFDIAVNYLTPTAARTPFFNQMSEEHIAYILSKTPHVRFLEIDEAARMIARLFSRKNSFTMGQLNRWGGRTTY